MSTPGFPELVFLAVLALLIFGPDKLPGMAQSVGKALSTFRREARSTIDELKRSADLQEIREVAGELRSTTTDLKRSAALTGPLASSAGAQDATPAPASVRAELPAPFDPDAT